MRFKSYIENSIELEIASFLESILDKAFNLYIHGEKNFQKCIKSVWPKDGINKFDLVFPANFPPLVAGQPVVLVRAAKNQIAACMHSGNKFIGFKLNIGPIMVAQSTEEAKNWVDKLKYAVHHEAEHIQNIGTDYEAWDDDNKEEKIKATIKYLSHDGEIKAHAREFARIYSRFYPNQPLDISKAKQLLPNINQAHANYFSLGEKWDQYQKYGFNNPYEKYIQLIFHYLKDY